MGPRLGWTAAPPTHGHVFAARTSELSLLAPASTDPRWGHRDEPRPRLPRLQQNAPTLTVLPHLLQPNCDTASHKQECCSGIKRAALQSDTWLCIDCGGAQPISRPNSRTAQNAAVLVGQIVSASPAANLQGGPKRSCLLCDRSTRPSIRPLICAGCLRECHKISSLSRTEQEMYILAGSWRCDNCSVKRLSPGITRDPSNTTGAVQMADVKLRSCLSILQWNANGIKTNMVELEEMVRRLEIDIIMIQESKLRSLDKDPRISGYSTIRKDRDVGMGGGLVTFIKEDIPLIAVNHSHGLPDSKLEALIIDLNPATLHRMTCVNVYRPPSSRAHQDHDFSTSELPTAQNIIIGGDLNVHASSWDQWQPEDEMGAKLEDWMADNDFGIVNDGSATRVNAGKGGRRAPDVTMVNNLWLDKVEWSTIECMGSDHLPIIITVDCPLSTMKPPPISELRWNWAKADFEGFSRYVEVSVMTTPLHIAIASLYDRMRYLNEAMLSAAKVNIGKMKATTNDKEWMSREIRDAIRTRNHIRRDIVVNRREWVSACLTVQLLIRTSKEDRWRDYISSADLSANPNKIWSTIKSLSGKCASSISNETLVHNGKNYSTSKAKADAFMRRYAAVSRLTIPKPERRKNTVRRLLNVPSVDEESCKKFTLTELKSAIVSMKPKGAPSRDRIAPRFIRALGPQALDFLLSIYNDSWSLGVSPSYWKEALIIPLLKKGKPRSQIDSFRPVSLTSCIAKTMERMVVNRLAILVERVMEL